MKYINITHPDINNGNGCRVTLWIPGCTHKCPGCHNEWTQNYNKGIEFNQSAKDLIFKLLSKDYIAGLTLSGGDPLDQSIDVLNELEELTREIKQKFPNKDIWVYTGCIYEELSDNQLRVLKNCDILVDGPYVQSLRDVTLPFRGSSNQRIIELKNIQVVK